MLFRCPSCGGKIRVADTTSRERFSFLCQECQQIVHLNPEQDEIRTTSSAAAIKAESQANRILVVDDSTTFSEMVKDLLFAEGFDVDVAHDGVEALKKIMEVQPDAIFLDLFMPKMTG